MTGDRGISRRALLLGGGGAAALGAFGWLASHELRSSGEEEPPSERTVRLSGRVDHRGAEWIPASPANYRQAFRPYDHPIDRVVIHMPEATFPLTLKVFQDPGHRASTHYVVRSADGHVAQLVREMDIAFHAGTRAYNSRSIGIEHEGWAGRPSYLTDAMYRGSAWLTAGICDRYGIPRDRRHIIPHFGVPGAQTACPGPYWDWDRYLRLVQRV